ARQSATKAYPYHLSLLYSGLWTVDRRRSLRLYFGGTPLAVEVELPGSCRPVHEPVSTRNNVVPTGLRAKCLQCFYHNIVPTGLCVLWRMARWPRSDRYSLFVRIARRVARSDRCALGAA